MAYGGHLQGYLHGNSQTRVLVCSADYNFNPMAPEERRRIVLTLAPLDFAVEWLRPLTPDFKMVGPVLAGPGKPLSADLEVSALLHMTRHHSPNSQLLRFQYSHCDRYLGLCAVQAFMQSAGEQGVLLVSLGTIAEPREQLVLLFLHAEKSPAQPCTSTHDPTLHAAQICTSGWPWRPRLRACPARCSGG